MSRNDERGPRGGPVASDRGRAGPFSVLLEQAARDPEAARGLVLAYAALSPEQRLRLIEAIFTDAQLEGVPPARVLVHLLAVEDDVDIARRIAEAIHRGGGDVLAAAEPQVEALLAGDGDEGGAALVRPLHQGFVEVLALAWRSSELADSVFEPMVERDALERPLRQLQIAAPLQPVAVRRTVDAVTPLLWRHLRQGSRPPAGLERFVDLFDV